MDVRNVYVKLESNFIAKTKSGTLALTLDEARVLYEELGKIFNDKPAIPNYSLTEEQTMKWVVDCMKTPSAT